MSDFYDTQPEVPLSRLSCEIGCLNVRLNIAIGIFCSGQQRVLTELLGRNPIKFERRHARLLTGSMNSAWAQIWPPSVQTDTSVTSVFPDQAAPNSVYASFGGSVSYAVGRKISDFSFIYPSGRRTGC